MAEPDHDRRLAQGPKRPTSTVLSAAEEALVVVLRKHTRLVDCDEEIPALREQLLDTIPCLLIDDRIMKAFVNLPVVGQPPR